MKKLLLLSAALTLALPAAASAATTITATAAPNTYVGPTPTYDFDTVEPIVGGTYRSSNISGTATRPTSSTGGYYAVGGANGSPAVLTLDSLLKVGSLSFLWGTPDDYNLFEVLDGNGQAIASYTGSVIQGLTNSATRTALVTLNFSGTTVDNVKSLRFTSSRAAFEIDNVNITAAVPEPTTWMLMMIGMAGVGFAMRRKKDTTLRVRFA